MHLGRLAVATAAVLLAVPPSAAAAMPLPTGRAVTPAGQLLTAGDFPASAVVADGGVYVADNGQSLGSLQAVNPIFGAPTLTNVPLEPLTPPASNAKPTANSGELAVSPDGTKLYLPGAALGTLDTFTVTAPGAAPTEATVTIAGKPNTWGAAPTADGHVVVTETYASGGKGPSGDEGSHALEVDPATGAVTATATVGLEPFGVVDVGVPGRGERVVVLDRGSAELSVLDPAAGLATLRTVAVGRQPAAAVATDGGRTLLVTSSLDDVVDVVDTATWKVTQAVKVGGPNGLGAAPSAIAVDPAGDTAWVTLAADDAVAQLQRDRHGRWSQRGEIPTAAYPTGVAYVPATAVQGPQLAISDGKGVGLPQGTPPGTLLPPGTGDTANPGPTGVGVSGTVELVALPDAATLATDTAQVAADDVVTPATASCPPPPALAGISHVVYVIRENKTYDEDLGDTTYGDPALTMYGQAVTPNLHAIAARSVLLGNFNSDEEVSDTGHAAVMGGVANDGLERATQQSYGLGGTPRQGPELGNDDATNWSPSNFLLDDALAAGVSFRDYGEFFRHDQSGDGRAVTPALQAHIDSGFPGFGFDPGTPDTARIAYWRKQFDADVAKGTFPQLEVLYLPEDHTTEDAPSPSRPVPPLPQQQVADSDLATGQLVDALSHSPYWGSTAVFMTEDDPQSGNDHVDAHRTVGLLTGGRVVNTQTTTHYDSGSMLRTVEELLSLPAMTELDATAQPMDSLFSPAPDPTDAQPYTAITPSVPAGPVTAAQAASYAAHLSTVPGDHQFAVQWYATHGSAPVPAPAARPAWASAPAAPVAASSVGGCATPPASTPEVGRSALLPAAGALVVGGVLLVGARRRRLV